MAIKSSRNKAHLILDELSDAKIPEALNYLEFLNNIPESQLDDIEELMENLGWTILGSEVAKRDWE